MFDLHFCTGFRFMADWIAEKISQNVVLRYEATWQARNYDFGRKGCKSVILNLFMISFHLGSLFC